MNTKTCHESSPIVLTARTAFALVLLAASAKAFDGSGSGTAADPYQISTVNQLQQMGLELSAHYILTNDVDATATATWNGGAGFTPVGSAGSPFTGSLGGGSHAIRNLTITLPDGDNVGLFGCTGPGSAIENMTMDHATVSAVDWVGTIAGTNHGTIRNCHATGAVTGGGSFGGLVGTNHGTIEHSSSGVTVSGGSHLGGLAGVNSGIVRDSFATGGVNGSENAGGLAGINAGIMENCYATGSVQTDYWWSPGYARGAGGLVGTSTSQPGAAGQIRHCFSTGSVTGPDIRALGGLIGVNLVAAGQPLPVIGNCYFNHTAANPAVGLGQNPAGGTSGIIAIENSEAYFFNNANPPENAWDFTIVWGFPGNMTGAAYPCFRSAYQSVVETLDSGGHRSSGTTCVHDGSIGMLGGVSSVSTPSGAAKTGYVAQLYEVNGLMVGASPATLDETSTRQLSAWQVLDDDSQLAVSASAVTWSVVAGPITGITDAGVATAAAVYQDTPATVEGILSGFSDTLDLNVINILPDNFGSYAGDQLDDSWQNQYFGLDNPDASPLRDPDGDGQDNRFEFIAGIVPIDPESRFWLRIEPVPGQSFQKRLVFSPRWPDRTYQVVTSGSLEADSWSGLADGIITDDGSERTVIDPSAGGSLKFYRVRIVKP